MDRNQEMMFELERYKEERKKIKLDSMNQEAKFIEKYPSLTRLEQLNKLKEQEFKEKLEKEQIKRTVKDLDKDKLKILKKEKEIEQERVAQEAQLMQRRERELKEQVERLENEMKENQRIYEENARKVHEQSEVARKVSDQENLKRRLFEEKAQRIADLKARQNNLLGEKQMYEKLEAEIKAGQMPDREQIAKAQERVNANGQQHLSDIKGLQSYNADNLKSRIENGQRRIDQLRNEPTIPERLAPSPAAIDIYQPPAQQLGMSRPMSKRTLAAENALAGVEQRYSPEQYNPGYNPALDVLNQRQTENERLRAELDALHRVMEANQPTSQIYEPTNQNTTQATAPRLRPAQMNQAAFDNEQTVMRAPNAPIPQANRYFDPRPLPRQAPQQAPQLAPSANYVLPSGNKDFDDFLSSNFMQNQMKNVDLNEDERMLVHLTMMEADSLRMLSRIPQNTELYRFKLEQYKELSTQRAEAEKIVQETRLKKIKRALDLRAREDDRRFENQKFLDDVRKQTVANQLVKEGKIQKLSQVSVAEGISDMNPRPNATVNDLAGARSPQVGPAGDYNQNHGFVVHWDYVFGIPKNKKFCQLVFAVVNGEETVLEPQMVAGRGVQDQNVQKNQCVIYENNTLREIEPNKFTNLIVEVQMPLSLNNTDDYVSLGWTFINLFDVNNQLNRGKFKLPLYQPPIYRNVTKDAVDQLKPVLDTSFLFRISYPWKDEFSNLKNLEPHLNHRDYLIPALHIKQASQPGVMATNLFSAASPNKQRQLNQSANSGVDYDASDAYGEDTIAPLPQPIQRRPETRDNAPSTTTRPETPHELIARSKGLKVDRPDPGDNPLDQRVQARRESEGRGLLYEQPVLHAR